MSQLSTEPRAQGRGLFWAGIAVSISGILIAMVQFSLKILIVPWYMPALTTLGALLVLASLGRRKTLARMIVLPLLIAFAGFQWFALLSLGRLPEYQGPAQAGRTMPAFQTALADGRTFSDDDLRNGKTHILTF